MDMKKDRWYNDRKNYMFQSEESQRRNLYYILTEINVKEEFIIKHADWIDEATKMEKERKRNYIQKKIDDIEAKGGKTNYYDMYEMYGRVSDLWTIIIETQRLSESFIEKYMDKFKNGWSSICKYQKLSEDFMRKHSEKLNWWSVAHFQNYSQEFYFEFFDNISSKAEYKELITTKEHLRPERLTHEGLILLLKIRGEL
jgi:hypothetical protein